MKLSKAIQGYGFAASADGYSAVTLTVYKSALQTMLEFLGDKEVGDITTDDLRSFLIYLQQTYVPERRNNPHNRAKLSTASIHRYWKAMRSFFKFADAELHTGRPDAPIRTPKWESKAVIPFTENEIKALIKACDATTVLTKNRDPYNIRKHNALRDKCIIMILLDTGVRVGELCRLRMMDVNPENGNVFVRPHHVQKTHSRTTFIGKATRRLLWRYIATKEDTRQDDPLFVTVEDHPMTRERVLAILKRLGRQAGVQDVHPHKFRHTFAVEYLRNGGDIFTLKSILGHSNFKMVDHYLELAKSDLENAHRKASPVDRFRL